jgi:hypothetical protein
MFSYDLCGLSQQILVQRMTTTADDVVRRNVLVVGVALGGADERLGAGTDWLPGVTVTA